jgi:hypothetical protein
MERFGNDKFACFRAVSIGGVDEIDAELDCATQNFPGVISIGRPTPDSGARQAHRAKPKAIHGQIAPQLKCRCGCGTRRRHKFR